MNIKSDYIGRINRVIDYIEKDLIKEFTLEELSQVASFSKFHFHRIFASFTGETIFSFIHRLRLERATLQLIVLKDKSITDIAFDCGFSSSQSFAKAFKKFKGCSASDWRERNRDSCKSNMGHTISNLVKDIPREDFHIRYNTNSTIWRSKMSVKNIKVEVRELPTTEVAYLRHTGPYAGNENLFKDYFTRIFKWAGARGYINEKTRAIAIYHDNPEVTDDSKLRTSIGLIVPNGSEVDGEVNKLKIDAGKYAFASFELDSTEYAEAWKWVYSKWLPQSGYIPGDSFPFEMYSEPTEEQQKSGKHPVEICIPVKPA